MRRVDVHWSSGRREAVPLPLGSTAAQLRELLAPPARLVRLRAAGRALADSEPCPAVVAATVALRGGWTTDKSSFIVPILLSVSLLCTRVSLLTRLLQVLFVGCCIAGPILVVRESNAGLFYSAYWWVGMGLCIAACVLLIVLVPVWIYLLCCD